MAKQFRRVRSSRPRASQSRALGRRRKRNLREPSVDRVQLSVAKVIDTARTVARDDHRDSFASKKEGDLITSVYLRQALDKLTEEMG